MSPKIERALERIRKLLERGQYESGGSGFIEYSAIPNRDFTSALGALRRLEKHIKGESK